MEAKIHPTAIVMQGATIAENCQIGAFTIIGGNASIGAGTVIGANCEIGVESGTLPPGPLEIGEGSLIRSNSIFYRSSRFGPGLRTGHRVTVREGVTAGRGLQLGTLNDLQGHCRIGDYVRFHSNVHVGQQTEIGDFVWIFPYAVLTNDPHPPSTELSGCRIGRYAAIATMATVLPGVEVGEGALVGAMTLVKDNVEEDSICVGVPGKVVGSTSKIKIKETGKAAYPWRRHFHRGYPDEVIATWKAEFPDG